MDLRNKRGEVEASNTPGYSLSKFGSTGIAYIAICVCSKKYQLKNCIFIIFYFVKISLEKRDNLRLYILTERPKEARTYYRKRFNN
ncbi:uncharacterized protein RAG0_15969 [Rhynchosporium agropyri]|uniref:Uncharacterized protein n=1 Tax=Rhynchosporium agropyri TaxID=914238 RepID=A0A1E1LN85_9HELO|nr:uncharacterized protein RAG0_15969 [Rhynchosporium agropyri]